METEGDTAVRLLFSGACQGHFNKFVKKVERVNNRNGPFDALFCVGSFFSDTEGSEATEGDRDEELMQFLESNQSMPVMTYIVGAYGHGSALAKQKLKESDCHMQWLGKSGVLEMPNGMSIAFLEGKYNVEHFNGEPSDGFYTRPEIETLKEQLLSRRGDIDLFLSCEWPEGVTNKLPNRSYEALGVVPAGSPYLSNIVSICRPRYHFTTSSDSLFFSRTPYINPDLGAGSHVTRFISLCPYGSTSKQNLFALRMTPVRFMTAEKLTEIPDGSTPYPFLTERKRHAQVWKEGIGDDSSCTPHPPSIDTSMGSGWGSSRGRGFQQGTGVFVPGSPQMTQSGTGVFMPTTPQSARVGNGDLGSGIQALLYNIGRGDALAVGQAEAASLLNQGSLGSDQSFGGVLQQTFGDGTPHSYPSVGGMPSIGNYPSQQLPLGLSAQMALGQLTPQSLDGNVQELWASLSQNPQLLDATIQMELMMNQNSGTAVQNQNPAFGIEDLMLAQQKLQLGMQGQTTMPLTTETISESILPDGQTTALEGHQSFGSQSKRPRGGSIDLSNQVVKDRRKTCFVSHLPAEASKYDVAEFFSQMGQVVHVVKHQGNGREANWAFVQYATVAERDCAIQSLNGKMLGTHHLVVKEAKENVEHDLSEPVKECWFCLGSPSSDKALIVSVGKESYLAIDKGPITDDHVLIVPTCHYPNTMRMSESCYAEMQQYLIGLKDLFASQGRYLLAFERYLQNPRLQGNHTHISVISIDEEAANNAKQTFIERGQMQEGDWGILNPEEGTRDAIHDLVGDEEYVLVILPDGSKLVRTMFRRTRLPVSFCRDVMAELAGIPERADWKLCLSSEAEEKSKVEKFKTQFNAFDYPNRC